MRRRYLQFTVAVAIAIITLPPAFLIGQQSPRQLFERAKIVEEANTDLPQAIRLYEQAIAQSKDRALTSQALLRMGGCYEKLDRTEARKPYERITKEFSDQKEAAAGAGRRLRALGNPPADKPATTRTLATDNVTSFTSISSDGRWMATTDHGYVAIRDLSTGQLARLETPAEAKLVGGAERAVLSPDLKQVAYTFWTPGMAGIGYQLRIIPNVVGSKASILSDNPEFDFYAMTWFPDGKSLLATAVKADKTWQLVRVFLSDHSIKVLTSLGWRGGGQGVPGQPNGPSPSLSPDGRYIVYSALAVNPSKFPPPATDPKDLHIYILPTDGSGYEIELAKNGNNKFPVWSPDGSRVVFTSDASGKWDLSSVPVRDGNAGPLAIEKRDVGDIQPIGMTRSGSFFYIRSLAAVNQFSIAEITANGGSRILETLFGTSPTWSPDGNSVAFFRRSERPGNSDLVVRLVDSGTEKVYASGTMRTSPPTWFHDGHGFLLQVAEPQPGVTSVFFADARSGEFKQILPPLPETRRGRDMALSPDDKTVYYTAGEIKTYGPQDRIIAVDLSNGQSKTVFVVPGTLVSLGGVALSPDGRTLALSGSEPARNGSHLALVQVDGSGYHEIYGPFRATPSSDLAWTKDGREIIFSASADDGTPQILRIGIDGSKPQFTGLAVKGLDTFAVSSDGSHIAYNTAAATSSTSELLVIDNFPAFLKDSK